MKFELKEKIMGALQNAKFDSNDFQISESTGSRATIKYLYSEKSYTFTFLIPSSTTKYSVYNERKGKNEEVEYYVFEGTMNPGIYSESETYKALSLNDLITKIHVWLEELDKELTSLHNRRKFETLDNAINEINVKIDELTSDFENEYMTKEEGESLRKKLDEVHNYLEEKLNNEIEDKKQLVKELDSLKIEFEKLKNSTNYLKKKDWLKKYFAKACEWSTNPEKRKFLAGSIKLIGAGTKLLGLQANEVIPNEIIELLPKDIANAIPNDYVEKSS